MYLTQKLVTCYKVLTYRVEEMQLESRQCSLWRLETQKCLWASHLLWTRLPIWPNPSLEVCSLHLPQFLLCRSQTWELSSKGCFPLQLYHRTLLAMLRSNKSWSHWESCVLVPSQTFQGTASSLYKIRQTWRTPISVEIRFETLGRGIEENKILLFCRVVPQVKEWLPGGWEGILHQAYESEAPRSG